MAFVVLRFLAFMHQRMVVQNPQLAESHATNLAGIGTFSSVLTHVDFQGFLLGEPLDL